MTQENRNFTEYSQNTIRIQSEYSQNTFRVHSEYIQSTFRVYEFTALCVYPVSKNLINLIEIFCNW